MIIADPSEPETLFDRLDRQGRDSKDEVGHGVQGCLDCFRRLHEPPALQHRGVDRRRVQRQHWRVAHQMQQRAICQGCRGGQRDMTAVQSAFFYL